MTKQESIGRWIMGLGCLLLLGIFVICMVDLSGLTARGRLLVPLSGYLWAIFFGVAMQFVGSAVMHMRFTTSK